jgi:hypothetical protein
MPANTDTPATRPHCIIDKLAFERNTPINGYMFRAWYLSEPKADALVQISKDGAVVREFLWPAYKIWNIPAHEQDIVDDIERGLRIAASTGLEGL